MMQVTVVDFLIVTANFRHVGIGLLIDDTHKCTDHTRYHKIDIHSVILFTGGLNFIFHITIPTLMMSSCHL